LLTIILIFTFKNVKYALIASSTTPQIPTATRHIYHTKIQKPHPPTHLLVRELFGCDSKNTITSIAHQQGVFVSGIGNQVSYEGNDHFIAGSGDGGSVDIATV